MATPGKDTANIGLFKKYIDLLDEVYISAATSSVLDGDMALVQKGANANEIVIPKYSLDGLADYSRKNGYAPGDISLTFESVAFNYDRGRSFQIDAMDDEETVGLAFGSLAGNFIRDKVVPELDAWRFAGYAGTTGIIAATPAALSSGQDWLSALLAAQNTMDEEEVPTDGRILFITPTGYNMMANVNTYIAKATLDSFGSVVKVPQRRFNTQIELRDGTSENELAGGFAPIGNYINFMVIERSAVLQYTKHIVNKVVTPEENQSADMWKFFYRAYGLRDVYENKRNGIYLHASNVVIGSV